MDLDHTLNAVRRRLRLARLVKGAVWGAAWAMPLGLAVGLLHLLAVAWILELDAPLVVALAPAAAGALFGALWGMRAPVPIGVAAAVLEHRVGRGALFSTLLELEAQPQAPDWLPAVRREAEQALAAMHSAGQGPRQAAPIHLPARAPGWLALGVSITVGLILLPPWQRVAQAEARQAVVLEQAELEAVRKLGSRLRRASDKHGAEALARAGKQLEALARRIETGRLDRLEALARLGEVEEELRGERQRIAARAEFARRAAQEQVLEQLLGGDLNQLEGRLADDRFRERARTTLKKTAEAVKGDPRLAKALRDAARGLRAGATKGERQRSLSGLKQAVTDLPPVSWDEGTKGAVQRAFTEMERVRKALAEGKQRERKLSGEATTEPITTNTVAVKTGAAFEKAAGGKTAAKKEPPRTPEKTPKSGKSEKTEKSPAATTKTGKAGPEQKEPPRTPRRENTAEKKEPPKTGTEQPKPNGTQPKPKGTEHPKPNGTEQPKPKGTQPKPKGTEQPKPNGTEQPKPKGTEQPKPKPQGAQPKPKGAQPKPKGAQPQSKKEGAQPQPKKKGAQPQPKKKGAQPQPNKEGAQPQPKKKPDGKPGKTPQLSPMMLGLAEKLLKSLDPEQLKSLMDMVKKNQPKPGERERPKQPPKIPKGAEDLLKRLDKDTLKKLGKAFADMKKDMPRDALEKPDPKLRKDLEQRIRKMDPEVLKKVQDALGDQQPQPRPAGTAAPRKVPSGGDRGGSGKRPVGTKPGPGSAPRPVGRPGAKGGSGRVPGETKRSGKPGPKSAGDTKPGDAGDAPERKIYLPLGKRGKGKRHVVRSRAVRNRARVPFSRVPLRVLREALKSLDRQRVPESYERVVREYFKRLQEPAAKPQPGKKP